MTDWQSFSDDDGREGFRAILDGYLVFVREVPFEHVQHRRVRAVSGWYVHILMPEDERRKAFLAGPGFDRPVPLEQAFEIAERVAKAGRGKLERLAKRRELEAQGQPKGNKKRR
jgi:hypothetical protein